MRKVIFALSIASFLVCSQAAAAPSHPNATIFLDGRTVYLVDHGQRRPFATGEEFLSYGWGFGNITPATGSDMSLPLGPFMKAQDGTLALDSRDNRTIYIVGSRGLARAFASWEVFTGLGFTKENLRRIDMQGYIEVNTCQAIGCPTTAPVNSVDAPHPEGALVLDNGTVYWINNLGLDQGGVKSYPFASEFDFWRYGFDFSQVVPANEKDRALPLGAIVPDPAAQWK